MDLTDEQWTILSPLIPVKAIREDGKGRPRINNREVLNGILWVLRTGTPWQDLPDQYPSPATWHRRCQEWQPEGVVENMLTSLADDLKDCGKLDLSECFIDGTFVAAKKGGGQLGRPSGAKVRRSWQWQTAMVFLSPFTWKVLRRMKSPLWKRLVMPQRALRETHAEP
jgi:transposase